MKEEKDPLKEGEMVLLTERGCYHAASSVEAKAEMAEEFRDWLFGEVCVEIRKHGMYILPPDRHIQFIELMRRTLNKAQGQ